MSRPVVKPSRRQLEVVRLVAKGWTNVAIAGRLDCSTTNVDTLIRTAMCNTNTSNRLELGVACADNGWLVDVPATSADAGAVTK